MKNRVTTYSSFSGWIIGLLFPVINFIIALFNPNKYNIKAAFICFFTFVGLARFFELGSISDVSTYVNDFLYAANQKISLWVYFRSIPEAQQVDFYMPFMTWFVSRFSSDYRIFLGCLAMLNACFFAANVKYLLDRFNIRGIGILLLVVFIFVPRVVMLTHRWWMALQVFVYGLLPVLYEKKYWKLLWCIATPFIFHFSFIYPLIIVVIVLILPHKSLLPYVLIYFAAFVLDSFNFNAFIPFLSGYLDESMVSRTESYVNAELQEHNLFSQSATVAINIVNVALVVFYYLKLKNMRYENVVENETIRCIFAVVLSLAAFALIASKTEWGWRYNDLSNMLFMFFYLVIISESNWYRESRQVLSWITPLLLYFIAFQIRGFLCTIGPYQLFFGNYITTWFLQDTSTVLGFIKNI